MRARPLFTPCRIFYDVEPGDPGPKPGEYIRTQGKRGPGSAYRIETARRNRNRPERFHLLCIRWPPAEIPKSATVRPLFWYPRTKRAQRLSEIRSRVSPK